MQAWFALFMKAIHFDKVYKIPHGESCVSIIIREPVVNRQDLGHVLSAQYNMHDMACTLSY